MQSSTSSRAAHTAGKDGRQASEDDHHIALVEAGEGCSDGELRARLSAFGAIAWCNSLGGGRFLVRFLAPDALAAAARSLNGSPWRGGTLTVTPYALGQLLAGCTPADSGAMARAESIPAMQLPPDLDFFNSMLEESQQQGLQQPPAQQQPPPQPARPRVSVFQAAALQELEPCNAEWNPPVTTGDASLFGALEDELLSADASPMHSFSSGTGSTCQLWSQRSIGAVARKDLAKFAAMQHMAQQHSSGSPTPGSLLPPGGMAGLAGPWGSLASAGSSGSFAAPGGPFAAEAARRNSSPSGQMAHPHCAGPLGGVPRSPSSFSCSAGLAGGAEGGGGGLQHGASPLQLGRSGSAGCRAGAGSPWHQEHNLSLHLPQELGLGDCMGLGSAHASASADDEVLHLHSRLMVPQPGGQAAQQPGGAVAPLPGLTSLLGSSFHHGGGDQHAALGCGTPPSVAPHTLSVMGSGGFPDLDPMYAAAAGGLLGAPPPPPPPPPGGSGQLGLAPSHGPPGLLGQPPPPPPPPPGAPMRGAGLESYHSGSYDGRGSGTVSPVQPAPPPRALMPGGGSGGMWQAPGSGAASPRMGGPQPQSPSGAFRPGGPRGGGRGMQHGMSNLGQQPQQPHCYVDAAPYCGQQQQPPYSRVASPLQRTGGSTPPGGIPPPPPPLAPPGYVAAASAAVAACGGHSPSPMPSPASGPPQRCSPLPGPLPSAPLGSCSSVSTPTSRGALQPVGSAPSTPSAADAAERQHGANAAGRAAQQQPGPAAGAQAAGEAQAAGSAPRLKADGALFVAELLQLLKANSASNGGGNAFLCNLRDLLECAVSSAHAATAGGSANSLRRSSGDGSALGQPRGAAAGGGGRPRTGGKGRAAGGGGNQGGARPAAAPVDAAAFLGLLQEAAAPLLAAAAAAACCPPLRSSSLGHSSASSSRRGSLQRASEASGQDTSAGGGKGQADGPGSGGRGGRGGLLRSSLVGGGSGPGSDAGGDGPAALGSTGGSLGDLSDLPPGLLLRHSLSSGSKGGTPCGSPQLFPLHPRTSTHAGSRDAGSCGGSAPGTPHGTPMLLAPQTVPELLSARAALMRLLQSAHTFVHSATYSRMAARLAGIEDIYDSMHDEPVVVKRRKCREMAALRETVRRDAGFCQAVASVSSLRNHIYSLSRKVLLGYGHMEALPIDLLLGGLTSELAAILAEPSDPAQCLSSSAGSGSTGGGGSGSGSGSTGGHSAPRGRDSGAGAQRGARDSGHGGASASRGREGSGHGSTRAGRARDGGGTDGSPRAGGGAGTATGAGADAVSSGASVLPPHIVEFFAAALPLPKLALLVFAEFVPVDPLPSTTALPASLGGSADGAGSWSSGGGAGRASQHSAPRDRRSSSASSGEGQDAAQGAGGAGGGTPRNWRGHRFGGRDSDGSGPGTPRRGSRGSFSSGGGDGAGSKRGSRRSCGFDLVAEAAALEAAATAAAPLVAAAVCDLPSGRRQGSNSGN